MDRHDAENVIYDAIIGECEAMEHAGSYRGNGHHLAQKLTEMAGRAIALRFDPPPVALDAPSASVPSDEPWSISDRMSAALDAAPAAEEAPEGRKTARFYVCANNYHGFDVWHDDVLWVRRVPRAIAKRIADALNDWEGGRTSVTTKQEVGK